MSKPQRIMDEIRTELLSIIRRRNDLERPLSSFAEVASKPAGTPRFYVLFDQNPRLVINGLIISTKKLCLPDIRILDEVFAYAKSVWHLKDRLKASVRSQKLKIDVEDVGEQSPDLLVCADLANWKKHGANRNRSGLNPRLEQVEFDTSRSGQLELYYDGATKQKELLVENTEPIPFKVEVLTDGGKTHGNAIPLIWRGFKRWIPTIEKAGVLNGLDRQTLHLRDQLLFKA
jgi:hypothetical protein